jgi:hypothetical protein
MSWPVLAIVVVMAILVVILLATRGTTIVSAPASTPTEVDEAQLETLAYPGSTAVPQVEMGLHDRTGRTTQTSSRALWTEAEPEEVRTWFRDWLTSHGWKVDQTSARLSSLISREATKLPADQAASIAGLTMDGFKRGQAGFTLMVFPISAGSPLATTELPPTARTVYSMTYATRGR